jgi:recombination protein RecT
MTQENPIVIITQDILATKAEFMAVLSDQSIVFEREAEFAIQLLEANDYALKVAMNNRQSVVNAIKNIAAIGISLNPAKKQAYLVPRRPKAGQPAGICLDLSYMGLIDLAVDSGSIQWAQAKLVRENDVYENQGVDKPPVHQYQPFKDAIERGQIIGVYVVVKTAGGDYLTHEMSISEVHAIRDRSESWKSYEKDSTKKTPWITDAGEMIKKTVIKQASKTWPRGSGRLEQAIHHLNTDGGEGLATEADQPQAPAEKAIHQLSAKQFAQALAAIKNGTYTLEEIEQHYTLTVEQHKEASVAMAEREAKA